MNDDALLRLPAVCDLVGYKRSTIYTLVKARKFPAPVRLVGGGAVAWHSAAVRDWIKAQGEPTPSEKVAA